MTKRSAICLVVDGLRASALGTYGNTTFPTPFLDDLASRSTVAEWFIADSLELDRFYRGVWHGRHALRPESTEPQQCLPVLLGRAGIRQWLASDDPWLSRESVQYPFDETLLVETAAKAPAESIEGTGQAQFFSELILRLNDWLLEMTEEDSGSLLWVHARGLMAPWDAPMGLREKFIEEEVPMPEKWGDLSDLTMDVDDPDVLHGYRVAYAAQVAVLDACVGALLDGVDDQFAGHELLIMLLGSRGYSLGEHGFVGLDPSQLFGECLHAPWLTHCRGVQEPPQRASVLAMPSDVRATLFEWFQQESPGASDGISLYSDPSDGRQLTVSSSHHGGCCIRTPAWFLRKPTGASGSKEVELYAKPDDRWEYNDVASRCPDVIDSMEEELSKFVSAAGKQGALPMRPANPALIRSS